MGVAVVSFVELYEKGAEPKVVLDKYFSQWYEVKEPDIDTYNKYRFDRYFRRDNKTTKVEYKIDVLADDTNNLFVETWSSREHRRYGWAFASHADMIIYYAVPDTVYMMKLATVQRNILRWAKKFPEIEVKHTGYTQVGIAVPTQEIVYMTGEKMVRRLP